MMICYCLIQEGQLSQENVSLLEKSIENIVEENLASGAKQSWVVIPKGNGWLGVANAHTALSGFSIWLGVSALFFGLIDAVIGRTNPQDAPNWNKRKLETE